MAGEHRQCSGHELGQAPGDREGRGSLACCSPWGHKELHTTWHLNSNEAIPGSLGLPGLICATRAELLEHQLELMTLQD